MSSIEKKKDGEFSKVVEKRGKIVKSQSGNLITFIPEKTF